MSVYQNLYNLILQYVYGNQLPLSGELVVDLLATGGCVLLVALPFVSVFSLLRTLLRW